jgi:hypothetical protein
MSVSGVPAKPAWVSQADSSVKKLSFMRDYIGICSPHARHGSAALRGRCDCACIADIDRLANRYGTID